jgi:hypothetical protein
MDIGVKVRPVIGATRGHSIRGNTMSRKKMIGRVGVAVSKDSHVCFKLSVQVRLSEYRPIRLRFTAQANLEDADRAYSLQLDSTLRLADHDFDDALQLVAILRKAMLKEKAPRAVLVDGRAMLDDCELAQFLQACEKLGLHVSRFETWNAAFEWASQSEDCCHGLSNSKACAMCSAEIIATNADKVSA